ncbi:hypothetical protein HZC35_03295 [Candidatus Saganbacteria bacterium]|nr:hypothetical protein [Candidatus Saganbacteria bacterium]
MRKLKIGLGLLIAVVMLVGVGWGAGPTPLINYSQIMNIQGKLTKSPSLGGGELPDGFYDMTFTLQRSLIGALPSWADAGWTETKRVIVTKGIFNEQLGETAALALPVFDPQYDYQMRITVNGENLGAQDMVGIPLARAVRGTALNFNDYPVDARINNTGNAQNAIYGETNGSGFGLNAKGIGNTSGGIKGEVTTATNSNYGVYGYTAGTGAAVYGNSVGGYGISGKGPTTKGGVVGTTNSSLTSAYTNFGVLGDSSGGYGVVGNSYSSSGVYGKSVSGNGIIGASTSGNGIYGTSTSGYGLWAEGARGVIGFDRANSIDANGAYGVLGGLPLHTSATETGVRKYGVFGQADGNNRAVLGYYRLADGATIPTTYAVYGYSVDGTGVYGFINSVKADGSTPNDNTKPAVYGYNLSPAPGDNPGVKGESASGHGVYGKSQIYGKAGVYATNTYSGTYAPGYGSALELGQGALKIDKGYALQPSVNGVVTIDKICGRVALRSGSDELYIASKYLNFNSVVLVSMEDNLPNGIRYWKIGSYTSGVLLHVKFNGIIGSGESAIVHFLIIN